MNAHGFRAAVGAGLAAVLSWPVLAGTTMYKIDPRHSSANFAVTHLMISTVRGEFHSLRGTVLVDDSDFTKSSVEVTIDASTVDTRDPDRDKDLKSPNFFDVAQYPTIAFKSTKVENAGNGKLKVTGDLTLHGVTKSVLLDVTAPKPPIKDPWGLQRAAVSGSTKINRQDFGMNYSKTMDAGGLIVGNEVDITLDVEMILPPPAN